MIGAGRAKQVVPASFFTKGNISQYGGNPNMRITLRHGGVQRSYARRLRRLSGAWIGGVCGKPFQGYKGRRAG